MRCGTGFRTLGVRALAIAVMSLGVAAPVRLASAVPPALPLKIDLNAFDAMKKRMALPNGTTLAYVELGDRAGRPVVLIHGYTDSARDWVPLAPYLSRDLRLILIDIRGHGQSSKPECCYTRIDFAYDVKLLLDALAIRTADIVGHSLGSFITQTLAEYWPERAGSVVLISSTALPIEKPAAQGAKPGLDFRSQISKLTDPIDPDSPFMIEWWASPTPVDEDFLRRQRRDAAAIPASIWKAVLDQGLTAMDLESTLPRLKAATLLIWGSEDPIIPEDGRQALRAALPGAQVRVFAKLGHNPFWEDPRGVADVINTFLRHGK